ncbi:MAG: TatD family hydrolase [Pseudomonadota bacterium]|nr:TatD family hydrolase [Pseudomonadota bacterium]
MIQLVDSHCHLDRLDHEKLGIDIEQVYAQARQLGVNHMLCVSINMELWPGMMALVEKADHVYASVGVHPTEQDGHDPSVEELIKLAAHPKVIAIGETGLDYFHCKDDLEWQRDRLRRHIAAAKATGKPLIVHSRDAQPDTLNILEEERADTVGGVMHCFVDDWESAQRAIALNFYISFSGIVTFKSAIELQEVAKKVPLEWMLVETDSPYLTPMPHRGKTNQPGYTRHVAEYIAQLRGESLERVAQVTTENFFRLFKPNVK